MEPINNNFGVWKHLRNKTHIRMVLSESKKKANKNWDQKNRGRRTYIVNRGVTKSFIKDKASEEDLTEIENLIKARREYLANVEEKKLKIKKAPEMLKKVMPDGNKDYVVELKSILSRDGKYQDLWEEFKQISGDPLLLIISDNEVITFEKNPK